MRITRIMLASCAALALAGCAKGGGTDWGAVAAGTGLVLAGAGTTAKTDPKVAEAGRKIEEYCPLLRIAAAAGATVSNEKVRAAAMQASAVVNEVCAAPITDTRAALIVAARAYEAARAARIVVPPS